jgi:microcystin-dependent protein
LAILSTSASIATPGLPVGSIQAFAGANAPTGWLLCDGSEVGRASYPDLFNTIGTTYGAGNTTTTFNLPDLRGRVPAGKDNMGGTAAGRLTSAVSGIAGTALGTAGGSQNIPDHSHQSYIRVLEFFDDMVVGQSGQSGIGGYNARTGVWTTWQHPVTTVTASANNHTGRSTQATWVSQTNMISEGPSYNQTPQNVQPTLVVNYIVKAVADIARGGWYTQSSPPVVTQLPFNASFGDEVLYLADSTNGIYWHFRYDGQGTYPWKFIGGAPLHSYVDADQATSSTSYADLATVGPSISSLLPGDYDITWGARNWNSATNNEARMGISLAGAAVVEPVNMFNNFMGGGGNPAPGGAWATSKTVRHAAFAGGTITAKYRSNPGGSSNFAGRFLSVLPVRVKAA